MDRLSDDYRRKSRLWALVAAIIVTFSCNVDTIYVAEALWASPAISAKIADQTQAMVASGGGMDDELRRVEVLAMLHKRIELPVGWSRAELERLRAPDAHFDVLRKLLGLLITAFALTLGAPFWFEILKKLAGLRKPPEPAKP